MSFTHNLTFGWSENNTGIITQSVAVVGQLEGNASEQVASEAANVVAIAFTRSKLQSVYISSDQNVTLTTNGTQQLNTATVVAASGITGNGNASVIVTSAILTGSPVTYSVPVTTALTTAAQVAATIRTYLQGQSALTALYAVGGTGATVTLTALLPAANDSTLNIETENGSCTGLTTEASSVNTTAGVAVQDTLVFTAGTPLEWCVSSPLAVSTVFGGNVSSMCVTNYGSTLANVNVRVLVTSP